MEHTLALLIERIRDAAARRQPLRLRGGGSKDFYGERCEGELLDTRVHAGIVSHEPGELVVTARAGTPLAELEAALAAHGQCLPFEPPRFDGGATVGGMVAAGLSGPARASVGPLRDYVLGASLINGRGEHLVFGGQVMKNVAGYDVSRLMAGALGTLGLITEVSLKVLPVAPAEATLRFELRQAQALARLQEWCAQPLPIDASRWLEVGGQGVLYLRLRGARAAVEAACGRLGGERLAPQAAADWTLCRDQHLPWFQDRGARALWRLAVPAATPPLDLPEPPLVEWHGTLRWVRAQPGAGVVLRREAERVGGHATLFRPAAAQGMADPDAAQPRFHPVSGALLRIHQALKREFDPDGILNPGRLHPEA